MPRLGHRRQGGGARMPLLGNLVDVPEIRVPGPVPSSMDPPSGSASLTGGNGTRYDVALGGWAGFAGPAWALGALEGAEAQRGPGHRAGRGKATESALGPPERASPAATLVLGLLTSGNVAVNVCCLRPLSFQETESFPGRLPSSHQGTGWVRPTWDPSVSH